MSFARAGDSANRALGMCGMGIRRELKRHYGSPEAAEEAIRGVMDDIEALEHWASVVSARSYEIAMAAGEAPVVADFNGVPFRFSDLPQPMRAIARESIAAAMLAYTAELHRGVA